MKGFITRIRRLCMRIQGIPLTGKRWWLKFLNTVERRCRLLSPQGDLRLISLSCYLRELRFDQRGAISVQWLEAAFIGVILLVVLIQFLWQQGIPAIIEATSNTTALVAAGATPTQINWATFIGGVIIIMLLIGALVMGVRVAVGGSGGGGGGRSGRRYRRKR